MIRSGMEFFTAVEQMREYQKAYSQDRSPITLRSVQKREAEIDACIEKKRTEWARKLQPTLALQEDKK